MPASALLEPEVSDRVVPESVERGRIDDLAGEVGLYPGSRLIMKASSGIFGCGEMKPSALACSKPKRG